MCVYVFKDWTSYFEIKVFNIFSLAAVSVYLNPPVENCSTDFPTADGGSFAVIAAVLPLIYAFG